VRARARAIWTSAELHIRFSLDCGYRVDVLVEDEILLELKSVDELKGIHEAQLLTYMKLAGIKQGFLIGFNVRRLRQGLKSVVL